MRNLPIYGASFVFSIGGGVIFVFLEDLQSDFGLSDVGVGMVASVGFLAGLICQIVFSPLADRGHVFPLAVLATVSSVIGLIGFGFSTSLAAFVIFRALTGVGFGTFGIAARKALIGLDVAGGGAKLGTLLSVLVAGFILGPMVGALFAPLGFSAPFLIIAAAGALTAIPALRMIAGVEVATQRINYHDVGELLSRPRVQAALLCQIVVFGYIAVFDSTIDRFLTGLGASDLQTAAIVTCVGAPMLILPRIAGNRAERLGGTTVIMPALAALIPVMFGYAVARNLGMATVVGILHGASESFVSIAGSVLVLEAAGAKRAAVATSLVEIVGLSTAAVTASVAPVVYGDAGSTSMYAGAGVIGVALGLIIWWRVANAPEDAPGLSPTAGSVA